MVILIFFPFGRKFLFWYSGYFSVSCIWLTGFEFSTSAILSTSFGVNNSRRKVRTKVVGEVDKLRRTLREKCPNTEFFLVRIFRHSDWIRRDTSYLSVFSPNAGKYGPEKSPYLDTFHTVRTISACVWCIKIYFCIYINLFIFFSRHVFASFWWQWFNNWFVFPFLYCNFCG